MLTYFVSSTGSDSNAGNQNAPFKTLGKGVSVLVPGDSLAIRGGTYAESLNNVVPSGLSVSPITISAFPSENVIIRPLAGADRVADFGTPVSYIRLVNLILDGVNVSFDGVKITSGAHHITLDGCEVKNVPNGQGILISPIGGANNIIRGCSVHNNGSTGLQHQIYIRTSNNLIEGCEIYNSVGYGIHQYDGGMTGNIYRRNKIHNTDTGILLSSGSSNLAAYNLLYSNGIDIQVNYGEISSRVLNNTCFDSVGGITLYVGTSNIDVRNNIGWSGTNYDFKDYGSTSPIVTKNLFGVMQPAPIAGNIVGIDPLFVNSGALDFHLQSNSPAINAGANLSLGFDYDGIALGTQPDIGAFEFVQAVVPGPGGGYTRISWGELRKMLRDRLDSKGIFYRDS